MAIDPVPDGAEPRRGDGEQPALPPPSGAYVEESDEVLEGEIADDEREDRRISMTARSFSGPLPPPEALREYEEAVPGLGREIVDQWKAETAQRHTTIKDLQATDRQAMVKYYEAEKLGQILAFVLFLGVLGIAALAILEQSPEVGIASLVTGGASAIWAIRRRSSGPDSPPADLGDGNAIEALPPEGEPDPKA